MSLLLISGVCVYLCSSVAEEELQPPFARLKCQIRQRQHDRGHTEVEHHRPRIDNAARERAHVLNCGKVAE